MEYIYRCLRMNIQCFMWWYYGIFLVNKFRKTCVKFPVYVKIQLFECYV